MPATLTKAGFRQPAARSPFTSGALRRSSLARDVGNVLGGKQAGLLAAPQRQQQAARRLAAAAASTTAAEPEAATTHSQQRKQLPKNFDPAASEEALYKWWESNGYFKPDESAAGEPYVISMPPPNVTGKLHMGHAMFVTLQDIMTRYQRMRGRPALWLPGTDHAGIATQMVVEKQLAAQGRDRRSLGREAFEAEVWSWKAQYGGFITQQMRRLGASCDWSRERFTLDEGLSEAVLEAFVRLHDKGLIYRGSYMVNWSPGLQTAVSDLEVEYSEEAGTLYYFKYPVADSDEFLPVATTRPETILGDTAVAVHPEDERYKHLVGREAEVPLSGRRIRVVADEYVDREFGTGALKITPGHDVNDYEIGKRFGLDIINIMNDDGTLNAAAGPYAGMDRFAARKQLWADMEAQGLVIKSEPYQTRVPRSQRGGEIVEPLVREQWFVRMEPLAKPALEAVARGDIRILPERFEKVYNFWLENIKDWCISRQLWWGHRIPVWYVFDSAEEAAAASSSDRYVVAKSEEEARAAAEQRYGGGVTLKQESDVLDTWFSSGLWPFSTLGWPAATPDLERFYPTSVMETGHDILFFWVARMIMMGLEFTGRPPFHTVYLHGLVRDEKGRKMSKSLGNVVDPVETVAQYGADALRFTLATGTSPGQDLNLSLDRVNASRNFTNKLWNAGKFVLFNLEKVDEGEWARLAAVDLSSAEAAAHLALPERWVVSALHRTVRDITAAHERFDFGEAGRLLYEFVWSDFADWYIEAAKARLYGGDEGAAAQTRSVLVYVYDKILKLSHPFMPFITEEMWQATPHTGPALISAPWPAADAAVDAAADAQFEALQAAVRAVRNARAEYGVEPGRKVAATFRVASPELRAALEAEAPVLALLAKLDQEQVSFVGAEEGAALTGQKGQIELVVREGLEAFLPMAGLFDAAKETERLLKQQGKLEKELGALQGRLSNKKFVDKAPEKVVAEVKQQAAEMAEQLGMIQEKIAKFSSLAGLAPRRQRVCEDAYGQNCRSFSSSPPFSTKLSAESPLFQFPFGLGFALLCTEWGIAWKTVKYSTATMNKLYPLCLLSLLLANATSLEVAAAAAEPTTHTLIATDCSQYFTWQTIGIVYTLRKSGHPGPLTRLVSCTQKEWDAFPQADKDLDAELGISTHVAPSYSVHPRTGDVYPGINKPVAVLDWMARTHVAEDFVLVIDADMVMRRPLLPQELGAAPGTAISGFFGYLVGVTNELALRHAAGVAPRQDTAAGPAGRRGDQVGGFTLMEREDLRRVLPLWLRISEDVRFDPEAWHLTGDAYAQRGERPWIAEMYGYSFGCARAGVWHRVHPTAMLYPGYEVGPEHAADPVRLLHYGILWNVSGTGYSFDKHWHYDFDALACPPWSLGSDPRHTKRGLFAHPPRPSALATTGLERLRDLLAIEVLARLNEAFCDRHLRMCPPSEELHRECAVAQEIARELEEEYASLVIPPEEQAAAAEVQQPAGPQQEPGHHGQGSTGSIAEQPGAMGQPTEGGMGAEERQQHGGGVAAQEAAASGDADAGAAGGRGGTDAGQVHAEL